MSLRLRLLAAFAYVLVLVLIVLEIPLVLSLSSRVNAEVKAQAAAQAQVVATAAAAQGGDTARLRQLVRQAGQDLGARVIVVDAQTRRAVADGTVGELWVSSPSVASGYWGKPELSEEVFRARPEGIAATDDTTYLRTGDLGFMRGSDVFVTGRMKELLVLRGVNYHPEDIETAMPCPGGDAPFVPGELLLPRAPRGIDYRDMAAPAEQPTMPGDVTKRPVKLPATPAFPDIDSIGVPDA